MRKPIVGRYSHIAAHCIVDSKSVTEEHDRSGTEKRAERRRIVWMSSPGRGFCCGLLACLMRELVGGATSRELSDVRRKCILAARTRAALRA